MGNGGSKEKGPSFKVRRGKHHSCISQGCFAKVLKKDESSLELRETCTIIGWNWSDEHRSALKDCLMEWEAEMFSDCISEFIEDFSRASRFHSSFRISLFTDQIANIDTLTPLEFRETMQRDETVTTRLDRWMPSLNICEEWARDRTVHVLLLGDSEIGKNSLVSRWAMGYYLEDYDPTCMPDWKKMVQLGDTSIQVRCQDLTPMPEFDSMTNEMIAAIDVIIACCDATKPDTMEEGFQKVLDRYLRVKGKTTSIEGRSSLAMSWNESEQIAVVFVGLKCDEIDTTGVSRLSRMHNIPYIECSSKCDINVELVIQVAVYERWLMQMFFAQP